MVFAKLAVVANRLVVVSIGCSVTVVIFVAIVEIGCGRNVMNVGGFLVSVVAFGGNVVNLFNGLKIGRSVGLTNTVEDDGSGDGGNGFLVVVVVGVAVVVVVCLSEM